MAEEMQMRVGRTERMAGKRLVAMERVKIRVVLLLGNGQRETILQMQIRMPLRNGSHRW
jgi:hypothetical protein